MSSAQTKTMTSLDYRRATQLPPRNVYESAAQESAKQKLQQLSKRIPCEGAGQNKVGETCL